jgi:hypothetical protein
VAEPEKLNSWEKGISGVLGLLLVASAAAMAYFPPAPHTIKRDSKNFQVSSTSTPSDTSTLTLGIMLSGIGLFLFSLNGYRFTRFSAAGVSAESGPIKEKARKELTENITSAEHIDIQDKEAPSATALPLTRVKAKDTEYEIYSLANVPSRVIEDALNSWPTPEDKPTSTEFQFASRKAGKGNHSWQLKFAGHPLVDVSYGGYSKKMPTVKEAEA